MRSIATRRRALAGLAALPLSVAAFGARRPAIAAGAQIRLGILNFDPATPAVYAQDSGLFAQAGLDVSIQVIPSGSAVAAALLGGALDIGLSSLFSVLTAHAHNIPLTLVAGGVIYDKADLFTTGLVVKTGAPFQHPADLNGKIIAIPALQSEIYVNIRSWIDATGGHSETIQFTELNGPGIGPALDGGRIDAAGVGLPLLSSLVDSGQYRSLGDPSQGIAPRYLAAAWISTPAFVQKNAVAVRAFATAMGKASTFSNTHPRDTAPILAKYTGVDVATIARNPRSHYFSGLELRDIQPVIDASAKYQVIPKSFPARDIIA
jgi:NitT/TauT family transport system substrate-binding protein